MCQELILNETEVSVKFVGAHILYEKIKIDYDKITAKEKDELLKFVQNIVS